MNTTNPNDSKDTLSKTPFKNFAIGVIVILIFLIGHSLFAQVGVGNTNPQAQLDISASNTISPTNQDGILIPRVANLPTDASMTTAQDGMMVFYDNTGEDGKGFYYWDDTASDWIKIAAGITGDYDWTEVGANIERQTGDVYIGDTNATNNDIYLSDRIIDWDNTTYFLNPEEMSRLGQVQIDNGTTSTPSLFFGSDNTTGIAGGVNLLRIVTNGSANHTFTEKGQLEFNYKQSVLLGNNAGENLSALFNDAVFIGEEAGENTTSGLGNIALGRGALGDNTTGGSNIAIGSYTIPLNNGSENVGIGGSSLRKLTAGFRNTAFGTSTGYPDINSSDNTYIGHAAGGSIPSSSFNRTGNVFIGAYAGYNQNVSNRLFIENSSSFNPLIYGEFDNDILRINGELQVGIPTGTGYAFPIADGTANQVMTTDGAGNVSFQNVPGDGTGTDDQNLTTASLTGTTLNLGIENGTGTSVSLAALQDGTGTDDQTIDNFSLVGTTLSLSLEDDGQPLQTVNLASLQDGIGTDDQNIQNLSFNNSTNILTVGIENGTAQTVNLSVLDNTGNDWSINGNSGTNPTTNFIGTTDNQDLAFRTNNVEKVRITAKGQIETTQLQSVWIGENAGNSVTSGTRNTFVGRISGASITTGNDNTAIGGLSLSTLSTGIDNTAVGLGALLDLQNGDGNTFVGEQSGENLVTGSYNTVLGHVAGENMNGSSNIFIGHQAGRSTTGSNKLIIDNSNSGTSSFIYGEMDNEILRANAEVQVTRNSTGTISHLDLIETAANDGSRLRFSNSAETTNNWLLYGRADDTDTDSRLNIFYSGSGNIMEIYGDNTVELNGQFGVNINNPTYAVHLPNSATIGIGQGRANAWTTYSDSRVKSNKKQLENGLALITKMIPKTYFHHNGDIEDGILNITDSGEQTLGFIAQELYEVLPEAVQKPEDENQSLWSVNYDKVIPVTVKAIQELNKKIETLETENTILKDKLSRLEALETRLLAVEKSMNNVNTNISVPYTANE